MGPETALECVRHAVWEKLFADDACIVSRSPRGLELMMAVIVKVCGAFGLTISEKKTETMQMPIPHGLAQITINAAGQHYRQTASFIYLGGTVTETPNLSVEIDRRIRAGWMSFNRYRRELYDRPNASLRPEGADGKGGCGPGTPVRLWDVDTPQGPLQEAPHRTPQGATSKSRSLVQSAGSPLPALRRSSPADRM